MNIYLDDLRVTGDRSTKRYDFFTHRTYTAQETIDLLKTNMVDHVSLDHDLDCDGVFSESITGTGYDVACFIEQGAYSGTLKRLTWEVHSMNPSGAARMKAALENADRFWNEREVLRTSGLATND